MKDKLKIQRFEDLEGGVRIILRYSAYFSDQLGGRKMIFNFWKKSKFFYIKNFQQKFSTKFFIP